MPNSLHNTALSLAQPSTTSRRSFVRGAVDAVGTVLASAALSSCGFQLRGAQSYAFNSIYLGSAGSSVLIAELQRTMQSNGNARVITEASQLATAQVVLDVLQDQREKVVVGVNASGQVREFQLRLRFKFSLRGQNGKELLPETELLQERDISYSETAALSKEAEEALLYRNMQTDIVQQITRRLGAVRVL
jgi:LPS-assembly lipoprotein